MNSRKYVGLWKNPSGSPALTGYSHQESPEGKKEEIRWPACKTMLKALDISSPTTRVAPDLLKALTILSDKTPRSAFDPEDLKSYWKPEKDYISLRDHKSYYLQFFQRLY